MAEVRTIELAASYPLTTDELLAVLDLLARGHRAPVGADLVISWERGSVTCKVLTIRSDGVEKLLGGTKVPREF